MHFPGNLHRFGPESRHNSADFRTTLLSRSNYNLWVGVLFRSKGVSMPISKLKTIALVFVFMLFITTGFAITQDGAKQDIKAAGADTKNAAKNTGHAVSTGTKKTYDKTASGTKTAYDKTANGTKTATDKTVNGTKTVGKDVGHGTKVAAQDTANGTKKVGGKITGKPNPQ
jgi:hypothetical protein